MSVSAFEPCQSYECINEYKEIINGKRFCTKCAIEYKSFLHSFDAHSHLKEKENPDEL